MNSKSKRVCGAVLLGCLLAEAARAETFQLGQVEVQGQIEADAIQRQTVDAIDLDDIRRLDRNDVGAAAEVLPGVTLQSGGRRNERLLFVRGFDSRQVPIFLDGIPVYVPYDGNIDIGRFNANTLSRIEVSSGYTSLLYGPNTLGGSINLVTRKPSEPLEADARVASEWDAEGEFAAWLSEVYLGGVRGPWYAQATVSAIDRDHFRTSGAFTPNPLTTERGGERDNSASEDYNLQLRLGFTPRAGDEYALSYFRQEGEKGSPPYAGNRPGALGANVPGTEGEVFWQWPEYNKESLYFVSQTGLGEHEDLRTRFYYDGFKNSLSSFDDNRYSTQSLRGNIFNSEFDDYTIGGGIEVGSRRWARHEFKLAGTYKFDVHRETDRDDFPQENFADATYGVAMEDQIRIAPAWTGALSVGWQRLDALEADNQLTQVRRSGQQITAIVPVPLPPFATPSHERVNVQAGVFHEVDADHSVHAAIYRRSRFATLKDRFSSFLAGAPANPELAPESVLGFELGGQGRLGPLDYQVDVFTARLENAIQPVEIARNLCTNIQATQTCRQFQNVGEVSHRGVDLSLDWAFNTAWRAHTNYSYLDRENRSNPEILPINTPMHSLFSSLDYQHEAFAGVLSLQYDSARNSNEGGQRQAEGFVVANAKGIWHATTTTDLEFSVLNLNDEDYAYSEGFPEPGRRFLLGIRQRL